MSPSPSPPPPVSPEYPLLSDQTAKEKGTAPVSGDDVLMPHAFERLWGSLEPQGAFTTGVNSSVPQSRVVQHLNSRGFQVVAAGDKGSVMQVLFCARESAANGTGDWFLGEFRLDKRKLELSATFKCKKPALVPQFVKSFMLHQLFEMA